MLAILFVKCRNIKKRFAIERAREREREKERKRKREREKERKREREINRGEWGSYVGEVGETGKMKR